MAYVSRMAPRATRLAGHAGPDAGAVAAGVPGAPQTSEVLYGGFDYNFTNYDFNNKQYNFNNSIDCYPSSNVFLEQIKDISSEHIVGEIAVKSPYECLSAYFIGGFYHPDSDYPGKRTLEPKEHPFKKGQHFFMHATSLSSRRGPRQDSIILLWL